MGLPVVGTTIDPTWGWLLTQWDLEPSILIGLALLALGYYYTLGFRIGPFQRTFNGSLAHPEARPVRTSQLVWFWVSTAVLAVALLSPLDVLGDRYLFSVHMIQHLVLALVWPPLFLISIPAWVLRPVLLQPKILKVVKSIGKPVVAFLVFNFDLAVWHLPWLYDLTLRYEGVHIFEHLIFMAFGILAWWPLLSPLLELRLSYPLQLVYLFAQLWPMMALGVELSFVGYPLYTPYVSAPHLWGISPLADQQFGGLIMWMPGDGPYVLAMAFIFVFWLDRGDPVLPQPAPEQLVGSTPTTAVLPSTLYNESVPAAVFNPSGVHSSRASDLPEKSASA
jgi:putative membrane protein